MICYVTFELNDAEILLHHPVETWHSGKHILSLYYPIENVVPNITNTFNVYLRVENGSGTVGSVTVSLPSAVRQWRQLLHGMARLPLKRPQHCFLLGGGLTAKSFTDAIAVETMELVQRNYSDTISGRTAVGAFCRPVTPFIKREE